MTFADVATGTARPLSRSDIPPASLWRLFCFSLAALCVVWLPISLLQQIDALLNFATPTEVLADTALLAVMLLVVSALIALVGSALGALAGRLGASADAGATLAWALVGIPVVFLCAWQAAFATKLWLAQVLGIRLTTAHLPYRELWSLLPVLVIGLLWRFVGQVRLIHAMTDPLWRLRAPAMALVALSIGVVAWTRPAVMLGERGPDTARPRAQPGSPDIFVFSLDTLAAADAGLCGDDVAATMPRLRELAARSTCFTRHYAASNITFPSTATIETGTLPWTHWVVHGGRAPATVRDAAMGAKLQELGYGTHAFIAAQGASPRQHGTFRGYDTVHMAASPSFQMTLINALQAFPESRGLPALLSGVLSLLYVVDITRLGTQSPYPPENVYGPATRFLPRDRGDGRPLFMWLHSWPPHSPYLPPPSTRHRLLPPGELEVFKDFLADVGAYPPSRQHAVDKQRLRYRETIMGADESLGRFLDELARTGRLDDAVVIVTADHGESFERGLLGHGGDALHDPVIRIPLIVKLPRQREGRVVTVPTSQADIAPTVLELAGGQTHPFTEGRSLADGLATGVFTPAPVFSMAMPREGRFREIRGGHYAVIDDRFKLTCHRATDRCELNDLVADPGELRDLSSTDPATTSRLRALLDARLASAENRRREWFGRR
ncbi:sulfatase-like hydrolase/transferase [Piscinibacter sp. HJYY11]|uniref:sulfatase-like hydrolase/transferase n=1 Tax=Piscinibacter sp. HJYY11 TaxID=2801333 RepID=UPI00191D8CDD|nr:sulfatase-like hydrolase/transferase [Piscinibacter sp. HJYY11]MBL0727926.1 sulfatase-like hydrolase/transferase [Piscinibacter sp. HJYY11]